MATPRRLLPSISLLTAFEAVVRTGSTLAAARDLDLSQGAVSRLIQALEGQLGVPLFLRERRRLVPTDPALAYAREVGKALDLISRGSMRVRSNAGGGTLSLAILPTFGTRWLAPRLPRFLAAHPGITINLGTRLKPFDFAEEGFDAAIHFGGDDWAGAARSGSSTNGWSRAVPPRSCRRSRSPVRATSSACNSSSSSHGPMPGRAGLPITGCRGRCLRGWSSISSRR